MLAFDHEGRPLQFDTWLNNLQLYLLSDSRNSVSLFDHTSGAAPAPPTTADSATHSQWLTHEATTRLAIRNHQLMAECAHFGQHRTAQAQYNAVVARYSLLATAALGRLLLPYLFPKLSAFATVEDLPSMFITLYFIVTRLPDSLHSLRDHFLSLEPTILTIDLLEQHLLAAETSVVTVGAARGTPRTPFFEGCSPSPLAPSLASAAAVDVPSSEDVGAASASAKCHNSKGKGSRSGGGGSGSGGGGSSGGGGGCGGGGSGGSGGGSGGFGGGSGGCGGSGGRGSGGSGGGSTEDLCGGASESSLPGTAPAEALHTFTLDSGASCGFFRDSTSLTPLPAPVPVRLADPSEGQVVARSSIVLPCSTVLSVVLYELGEYRGPPGFDDHYHQSWGSACVDMHVYTDGSSPGHVAPPCSCRLLSHQTLLWHHRLGHPSLPRLHGMHSRLLVSGLPRSPPPLPPSPALPCLPCIEGRQRTAPHSSSFPPKTAPLQTLHMDYISSFASGSVRTFLSCVCTLTNVKNGIAEHHIGLVMEVARTSMTHAAATHFLWPFAVWLAMRRCSVSGALVPLFAIYPRTSSLPVLSPASSLAFPPDAPGWQFYHPTSRRVFPFQDVMLDKSIPIYRLFPYLSATPPPPPLFLALGPPPIDPLPPQGPAPSGVSQVDPLPRTVHVEVARDSGAARGAASGGAEPGGAEPWGAESEGAGSWGAEPAGAEPGGVKPGGAEPGGAEPEGVELGGADSKGAESGGAESRGAESRGAASSGGPSGASLRLSPRPEPLSPQHLREWLVRRARLRSRAASAGATGDTGARGPGVTAGADVTGGSGAAGTGGTGADRTSGVGGAGPEDPTESGATGAGGISAGAGGDRAGGTVAGGAGAGGAGAVDLGARGVRAGGAGGTGAGGTVRLRPYFVPLLQKVLGVPFSPSLTPPSLCPLPEQSQPPLEPASTLPAPSPYIEQTGGLTKRREPPSRPASPVCSGRLVPRPRPPRVPGTHAMALRPSSVPLRVPLPPPPESSLPAVPYPESDRARAASPTVSRLLAIVITDPSFESTSAMPSLILPVLRLSGVSVLEDRQQEFECLAAAVPHFVSMLVASEGDPDAPDILTPRSYAEAITGPYSSLWQAAMDAEMASLKSTGTYVDAVPPSQANIVDGMWIFRVKRPPGSPPAFKERYVARGFSQRQGVDHFKTFSPTPKMTTLQVLLHIAAQRDYELHSFDFSTAFLQGSTQWSILRPVYGLRQAPREWHDTLRTTLAALGFAPSTGDPSLFLCTDTSLPPFYIIVYVNDLVLRRFGFQFFSPQPTPLSSGHSRSAPPSDESVEPSGPYPELVGCLMTGSSGQADASWVDDLATQRSSHGYTFSLGVMAAQELRWLIYVLTDLGEQPRSPPVLYVDNKAMITLCQEHRLEHRTKNMALRYFLARELQQRGQLRLAYVATRANTADIFSKALPPGDQQRFSTMLGLVPTLPHLLTA
ncbi:unnamed protein product [Closterium sp. NIES-54]